MLYDRVKQLCANDGITIAELERNLKFGNGTIRNWNKSNPTIGKVVAVARYFGVALDALVSEMKVPTRDSRDMAVRFDGYSEEQKNLVRCYMSLIENGKVG